MENATKALVMAGGILVSIMVIATLLFSFNQWGIIPQSEDETDYTNQVVDFNKEFEMFNKDYTYGVDVISAINKAINNNEKYNATSPDDMYYIDVEFTINTPAQGYIKEYWTDISTGNVDVRGPYVTVYTNSLNAGTYSVSRHRERLENSILSVEAKISKETTKMENGKAYKVYVEEATPSAEFKNLRFHCTEIAYDEQYETGRVVKIVFEQVEV